MYGVSVMLCFHDPRVLYIGVQNALQKACLRATEILLCAV